MKIDSLLEDRDDIRVRLEGIDQAIDAGVRTMLQDGSRDECYLTALAEGDYILAATIARYCWHSVPPNTLGAHLWAHRLRDCEWAIEYHRT